MALSQRPQRGIKSHAAVAIVEINRVRLLATLMLIV